MSGPFCTDPHCHLILVVWDSQEDLLPLLHVRRGEGEHRLPLELPRGGVPTPRHGLHAAGTALDPAEADEDERSRPALHLRQL